MMEQSSACLCPSVAYQLAGAKKVQQDLAQGDVLQRFATSEQDVQLLQECFAGEAFASCVGISQQQTHGWPPGTRTPGCCTLAVQMRRSRPLTTRQASQQCSTWTIEPLLQKVDSTSVSAGGHLLMSSNSIAGIWAAHMRRPVWSLNDSEAAERLP